MEKDQFSRLNDQIARLSDQVARLMDGMARIESNLLKPGGALARVEAHLLKSQRSDMTYELPGRSFPPGRLYVAPTSSAASAAASALADLAPLSDVPVVAALPPLLAVLEDVQIEGAEVLPEVDQSLEQIGVTLDSVEAASASLEPTPSKVPEIQSAMETTSADVTAMLDSL